MSQRKQAMFLLIVHVLDAAIQLLCAPTTVLPGGLYCCKAFTIQKARTLETQHLLLPLHNAADEYW